MGHARPCMRPPARALQHQRCFQHSSSARSGRRGCCPLLCCGGGLAWGGISPSPSAGDAGPGGTEHPQCQRHAGRPAWWGHGHHVSPFPALICDLPPCAPPPRAHASGGWERLPVTKLEMTFLNRSVGEKVGPGRAERAAAGAASCMGTAPPRGGQEGRGGRGEQMPPAISPHKQIAALRKQNFTLNARAKRAPG